LQPNTTTKVVPVSGPGTTGLAAGQTPYVPPGSTTSQIGNPVNPTQFPSNPTVGTQTPAMSNPLAGGPPVQQATFTVPQPPAPAPSAYPKTGALPATNFGPQPGMAANGLGSSLPANPGFSAPALGGQSQANLGPITPVNYPVNPPSNVGGPATYGPVPNDPYKGSLPAMPASPNPGNSFNGGTRPNPGISTNYSVPTDPGLAPNTFRNGVPQSPTHVPSSEVSSSPVPLQ
jgi:hypothetical protein